MVFARGPWAHLFSGNYEQNMIPLTMGFAAGVGPTANLKGGPAAFTSAGLITATASSPLTILTSVLLMTAVIRRVSLQPTRPLTDYNINLYISFFICITQYNQSQCDGEVSFFYLLKLMPKRITRVLLTALTFFLKILLFV